MSIGKNIYSKVLDDMGWPQDQAERKRILVTTLPAGASILYGDELSLFKLESKLTSEEYQKFRRVEITIDYESVYGEGCSVTFDPKEEQPYQHKVCGSRG